MGQVWMKFFSLTKDLLRAATEEATLSGLHLHTMNVADAFKALTGEAIPDFAATGFEEEMIEAVRKTPYIHDPPVSLYMGRCRVCGQMATIEPEASAYQQHLWIHQNKPCPGYNVAELLNKGKGSTSPEGQAK